MVVVLFILAALTYGAASFAHGVEGERVDRIRARASVLLALAALLHFCCIGGQCLEGDHPFKSVFLATSLGALCAVLGFLLVAIRKPIHALGALLAPIGLAGLVLGVVFADTVVDRMPASQVLVTAHISLATAGLAGFTLAAGVASVYLAMERRIRQKIFRPRPGGVSLAGLDRLHHRLMLIVTPVVTLAIVTGVLWILRAGGPEMLGARWPELLAAAITWLVSVGMLVLRALMGVRGRQAARLTLVAFGCMLLIFVYYGVRS